MVLYPDCYFNKITDIDIDTFKKNNIKAIILDVDNTLLDFDLNIVDGLESWFKELSDNGIKGVIVSNSNKPDKIERVANLLGIDYIKFACKPLRRGLKKAQKMLDIDNKQIAVIGDQIFTDVIGANRCKMFSILVKPLAEKDLWMTRFKRPIENFVIKRYLKSRG